MKLVIDIDEAQHRLLEEREKLSQSLQYSIDQAQKSLLADPDLEEQAAYSALIQLQSTMRGYTITQLARVDKALERIKNGNYGVCMKCGKEISPGRLRAMPYVELCIHCQSRKEEYD